MRAKFGIVGLLFGACVISLPLNAQIKPPKPPRPMSVISLQSLSFGTISVGSGGGTITIDQFGGRIASGDLLPLGSTTSPATFEINVEPGTPISLASGFPAVLSAGNGHDLSLQIHDNIFVATGAERTILSLGGTLTIGPATPAGFYSGVFYITFVQE
jgi:hypothetical protein